MKIKSLFTIIFAFVLFLAISIISAGCDKSEEVTLVDFNDISLEVEMNDILSVQEYLTVNDQKGNEYDVNVKVTDNEGNRIQLIRNSFKIESVLGYEILLNATVDGKDFQREIQVGVKNLLAIKTKGSFMAGKEVEIETVVKNKDLAVVLNVVSPSGNSIALTDGNKFRPVEQGKYRLNAIVENIPSGVNEKYAKADSAINVWCAYKMETLKDDTVHKIGDEIEFLPAKVFDENSQEIETSVVAKARYYGEDVPSENGKFVPEKSGYYEIVYTANVDGVIVQDSTMIEVERANAYQNEVENMDDERCLSNVTANGTGKTEWLPTYVDSKNVKEDGVLFIAREDNWSGIYIAPRCESFDGYAYVKVRALISDSVSKLCVSNKFILAENIDYIEDVTVWNTYYFVIEDLVDSIIDGKAFFWINGSGNVYISEISLTQSNGYTIEAKDFGDITCGDTVNIPDYSVLNDMLEKTDLQASIKVMYGTEEIALTENTFVADRSGEYTIIYHLNDNGREVLVVKNLKVKRSSLVTEVENFSEQIALDSITPSAAGGAIFSWVDSKADHENTVENGVLKVERVSSWAGFFVYPLRDLEDYSPYAFVKVRAMIVPLDEEVASGTPKLKITSSNIGANNETQITDPSKWNDYIFNISDLIANAQENNGKVYFWVNGVGTLYISDISVFNAE